jgi:hypothetical protein
MHVEGTHKIEFGSDDIDLNDLELLSTALAEALDAKGRGLVIGPPVDEVTLRRAERHARRVVGRRERNTMVLDGVA